MGTCTNQVFYLPRHQRWLATIGWPPVNYKFFERQHRDSSQCVDSFSYLAFPSPYGSDIESRDVTPEPFKCQLQLRMPLTRALCSDSIAQKSLGHEDNVG